MITHTSTKRAISLLQNALREWDAKILSLQEQLEERDCVIAALKADSGSGRKKEIGRLEKKISRSKERAAALETVLDSTRTELAAANATLKERADFILRLQENGAGAELHITGPGSKLEKHAAELAALGHGLARRQLVISQLEAAIAGLRDQLHQSRRGEQSNLDSLAIARRQTAAQQRTIGELESRFQHSEEKANSLRDEIERQSGHAAEL
ncbi:MAG: hypothetical protein OES35_07800, partial [Chromatiales bacterium]|nr:hypothetical protein [Chromatiales bacterium]